jgi:hypothetical protein
LLAKVIGPDPGGAMSTVQISARIDQSLKQAIDEYCRSRGIVLNHFIEEALLDRLEELEDAEDIKSLRREPTRPLSEVVAEIKIAEALPQDPLGRRL